MKGEIIAKTDATFTSDQIDLIKRTVAKGATDDELSVFLHHCERTGLDPLARQIYFQKRQTKNGYQMTIITGIDGYRLIADRTGIYAGNDDPVFDDEKNPNQAKVTVWKLVGGIRCPFTATARWNQYYPGKGQGFMWDKMPHLMLGKCAEALALRKAFPAELSGLYVKEEMDQAGETVEIEKVEKIEPPPPPQPKKFDKTDPVAITGLTRWLSQKYPPDQLPADCYTLVFDAVHGIPFDRDRYGKIVEQIIYETTL